MTAHDREQQRIVELEAEKARCRHALNDEEMAREIQTLKDELVASRALASARGFGLIKSHELNAELEAQVAQLQAEKKTLVEMVTNAETLAIARGAALRQPCSHRPPGSEPGCFVCRVVLTFDELVQSYMTEIDRLALSRHTIKMLLEQAIHAHHTV